MTPLTWTLLMQVPTALVWYPAVWRLLSGKGKDPSYAYFMAFAYMLGVGIQHAGLVFSGAGIEHPLTVVFYMSLVPAAASCMAVTLAVVRRHSPLRGGTR